MGRNLNQNRTQFTPKTRVFFISLVSVAALCLTFALSIKPVSNQLDQLKEKINLKLARWFTLEQVVWEEIGSSNLSHLVTQADLWKMSSLKINDPLLQIDLSKLEEKLLELPWIKSVQFQKKLPHTLYVQYTVHQARALGVKQSKLWTISSSGEWMAPLAYAVENKRDFDLPVFVLDRQADEQEASKLIQLGLAWLGLLEKQDFLLEIHEIEILHSQINTLLEVQYESQSLKINLVSDRTIKLDSLVRLKQVMKYLVKKNILVSQIDLRAGQKIVVKVGKRI